MNFEPPAALTENITNEKKRAKVDALYRKTYEERVQLIKDNWKKLGWWRFFISVVPYSDRS
ncbi:MAG: hypothetical protein KAR44_09585 [Candidatus Aegiribacteria sp.]|nr:hypothetical protein [Candidatus Aegiribacteria sp.]